MSGGGWARVLGAVLAVVLVCAPMAAAAPAPTRFKASDWPMFGYDVQRTFHAPTTLTPSSVRGLAPAWYFHTGKAVSAQPIVVAGTVYVGSWDGRFYALDTHSGKARWSFKTDSQPAVSPRPEDVLPSPTSDGGMITATAWFEPGVRDRVVYRHVKATRHRKAHRRRVVVKGHPDLVIFASGYTVYALRAGDGGLFWKHAYTGWPEARPDPANDETRIFSSPLVVGKRVIFGVSADGQSGRRGYLQAARISDGAPSWVLETDVDAKGRIPNDGCGNVWASPTWLADLKLIVVGIADCDFVASTPLAERTIAVRPDTGKIVWKFTPPRLADSDPVCDFDVGATANAGTDVQGHTTFLGVAGKDGTYYSLDPRTGALRWSRNVVFGGYAGGFIATTAFDGKRVFGATALGDFGRFEGVGTLGCEPGNLRDLPVQEPSSHAIDAADGRVAWQGLLTQSFAPTTVAGGMVFQSTAVTRMIVVRRASDGSIVTIVPLTAPGNGIAITGHTLIVGTGSPEQDLPDGVWAFTPSGEAPGA